MTSNEDADADYGQLAEEIFEMVKNNAPPARVRAKAMAAKERASKENLVKFRWLQIIDNLVTIHAPTPDWPWGFVVVPDAGTEATQPSEQTQLPRGLRVLVIARNLVNAGAKTATAKEIARQLQAEGAAGALKDLATSAGNHLARSAAWKRVKPGEYAPVEDGEITIL